MKNLNHYVLTYRDLVHIQVRNGSLNCAHCDEPLEIGDRIVSKTRSRGKTKRYHESCYDEMWLEI